MLHKPSDFAFFHPASAVCRPLVGMSACLAGERVRYNGRDKRLSLLDVLRARLAVFTVCPEAMAGLGVPRPPLQLVMSGRGLQALGRDDPGYDATEALLRQRSRYYRLLHGKPLCGFILKGRSSSCGVASAPVLVDGEPAYLDNGIFADGLLRLQPWLAICEEPQVESLAAIEYFIWQCRLVQDVLFSEVSPPLAVLHRHYAAQFAGDADFPGDRLMPFVWAEDRFGFARVLLEAIRTEVEAW